MERTSVVEPFRDEMSQRDSGTPLLHNEVAINQYLSRCSGVGFAQETRHIIGEKRRRPGKSEKENCSHPDRGIQDSDHAKKPEHARSLGKTGEVPSLRYGRIENGEILKVCSNRCLRTFSESS